MELIVDDTSRFYSLDRLRKLNITLTLHCENFLRLCTQNILRMVSAYACCIIPVRLGSKRIPGKNLKLMGGKPLLAHVLDAALASQCFERMNICVVSDDERALELGKEMNVRSLAIPSAMAGDNSRIIPVLQKGLEMFSNASLSVGADACAAAVPNLVCYLRATSPFVRPTTIRNAVKSLLVGTEHGARVDSVVSVKTVTGAHPSRFKQQDTSTGLLVDSYPEFAEGLQPVSSSKLTALQRSSAVTVMWSETLLEQSSLWGKRVKPMVVEDEKESIDINTPLEFAFADFLMQQDYR